MNFDEAWTEFALEAERHEFGCTRIAKAHNEQIAVLRMRISVRERDRAELLGYIRETAKRADERGCADQASWLRAIITKFTGE